MGPGSSAEEFESLLASGHHAHVSIKIPPRYCINQTKCQENDRKGKPDNLISAHCDCLGNGGKGLTTSMQMDAPSQARIVPQQAFHRPMQLSRNAARILDLYRQSTCPKPSPKAGGFLAVATVEANFGVIKAFATSFCSWSLCSCLDASSGYAAFAPCSPLQDRLLSLISAAEFDRTCELILLARSTPRKSFVSNTFVFPSSPSPVFLCFPSQSQRDTVSTNGF